MSIIIFLIILLVLVVVHEFGHFITAKLSGIRVEEFGVGFPPRLFGKRFGETIYSVNALPFGGFVRIFGEQASDLEKNPHEHSRALTAKPKRVQALVIAAGVFFNLAFAWLLLSLGFLVGMPTAVDEAHLSEVSNVKLLVTSIVPRSPAEVAGLRTGDEPVSVSASGGSMPLQAPEDLPSFVASHQGKITLEVIRKGEHVDISITPATGVIADDPTRPAIGVVADLVGVQKYGLFGALTHGAQLTGQLLRDVAGGLWHLIAGAFAGTASIKEVTGPVGIVGAVGEATSLGLIYLITFAAFISINLSIVNLIPLPALDGGRLFFLLIEAIQGFPIRPRFAQLANSIGFALLILLMLVVTYNDIVRLVG